MNLIENFIIKKLYIYVIFIAILVSCCFSIISNASSEKYSKNIVVKEIIIEDKVEDNIVFDSMQIEFVVEKNEEEKENDENIKKEDDGKVTYKGVTVEVPEVVVAKVNDSEDKQNQAVDSSTSSAQEITVEETLELYENSGNSVGIDVSKWQGDINWAEVKKSGVEFAMIRIGYRGSSYGNIVMDPYYEKNVKGATSNGIKAGIYFFSMARNEEEAVQEAAWTVENCKKYRITYPVAYDFESWGTGRVADISDEQIQKNALAFLGFIKSSGYSAMMYGSKNALNTRFSMSKFSNYKVWLAHYTEKTNYTGKYHMWQYTDKGSVPGISGHVDMNIAYFSYSKDKEPVQPVPEEKPKEENKVDNSSTNKVDVNNTVKNDTNTLTSNNKVENETISNNTNSTNSTNSIDTNTTNNAGQNTNTNTTNRDNTINTNNAVDNSTVENETNTTLTNTTESDNTVVETSNISTLSSEET